MFYEQCTVSKLQLLIRVCHEIEPVLEQMVLVVGRVTELLLTDSSDSEVHYTTDVE